MNFNVRKMTGGSRRFDKKVDISAPISCNIVSQLLSALGILCSSSFELLLFETVSKCTQLLGFRLSLYKYLSFRTGRASTDAGMGVATEVIHQWNSNVSDFNVHMA